MDSPDIFDRNARRIARDRAASDYKKADFLRAFMLDGIADRLGSVSRDFTDILDLGSFNGSLAAPSGARVARMDAGFRFAAQAGGVQADEDRLPFGDGAFDLVVSAGVLDSVGDLPGVLALARRVLRPDGLFLAAFAGAGSLATLRQVLRAAEGDRPAARIHPQVDVRSAGDLLMRAGFALPVADTETLMVRYASLFGLLRDLRAMGAGNVMPGRVPLRRDVLARAATLFADQADADGRTAESFEIVYMTGWAPAPSQPQPARRGGATQSLAQALQPKGPKD
ncbi:class I SAM-dependent methyltransferase [Sphingomonas sp. 28-62-11]|uniref:class I SAM-dependent methyltransferase n=1 Tax=Sphingomonas sp. 28-62-11 TaxID=1970432 RepID=UPI0035A87995